MLDGELESMVKRKQKAIQKEFKSLKSDFVGCPRYIPSKRVCHQRCWQIKHRACFVNEFKRPNRPLLAIQQCVRTQIGNSASLEVNTDHAKGLRTADGMNIQVCYSKSFLDSLHGDLSLEEGGDNLAEILTDMKRTDSELRKQLSDSFHRKARVKTILQMS